MAEIEQKQREKERAERQQQRSYSIFSDGEYLLKKKSKSHESRVVSSDLMEREEKISLQIRFCFRREK